MIRQEAPSGSTCLTDRFVADLQLGSTGASEDEGDGYDGHQQHPHSTRHQHSRPKVDLLDTTGSTHDRLYTSAQLS